MNVAVNTPHNYFITGTNTDVGKTYIAVAMLKFFGNLGLNTIGLKPVAAGCEATADGLRNADALLLQQHATCKLDYSQINPVALADPIAPHIAAAKMCMDLSVARLMEYCQTAIATAEQNAIDVCIVEGAGGWLTPLNAQETMANFAVALGFPVVLVISIELGCINHALLTYNAIIASGLPIAGWVANCMQADMLALEENIASIGSRIAAPLLCVVKAGDLPRFEQL